MYEAFLGSFLYTHIIFFIIGSNINDVTVKFEGNKSLGRNRHGWENDIKTHLNEMVLTYFGMETSCGM